MPNPIIDGVTIGGTTYDLKDPNLTDEVIELKSAFYIDSEKTGSKIIVSDEGVTEVTIALNVTQAIPAPYLLRGLENIFPVSTLESLGNNHSTENVIVITPGASVTDVRLMDDYEFEAETSYRFSMWALRVGESGSRMRVYYTDGTYQDMYSTKGEWALVNVETNASKTVDYFNIRYSSYTADSLQILKNSVFLGKTSESDVTFPVEAQTYAISAYPTTFISNAEMTISSKQSIKDYVLSLGHGSNLIPTVADLRTTELEAGSVVETSGYYSPGDGGGAKYLVSVLSGETDDGCINIVSGQMVAKLLPVNERVNAKAFGIKSYGSSSISGVDDTDLLNVAINYSAENKIAIVFSPGYYYFKEINLIGKNGCMLEGATENISIDQQAVHFVSVGTATNSSNAFVCTNEDGAINGSTFTATNKITLKNLILHESASRTYGLYFAYTTSSIVSNIITIGFVNGIYISTTWYSTINRLHAKTYTGIGITITNTTNGLNLYDLYSESDQSADAAFYVYGSHSVVMTNVTIEGNSGVAFILREYASNRNGFVVNNLHCENVKCLIALQTGSQYSAFSGMSSGRIEINGGCWTPLFGADTCIIKQYSSDFYRLKYLALKNLFIDTRLPNEPLSSTLDISLVDNFEEKIVWAALENDITVMTESTNARIHGVSKSRYGVSECAGTGYDRIYSGRPDKYTVIYNADEPLNTATVIAPLTDYATETLANHHIVASVKYTQSNVFYEEKYNISVKSDGTVTAAKDGQGPITVNFTVSDGALKATEQADSMNFILEVENLEYYSSMH